MNSSLPSLFVNDFNVPLHVDSIHCQTLLYIAIIYHTLPNFAIVLPKHSKMNLNVNYQYILQPLYSIAYRYYLKYPHFSSTDPQHDHSRPPLSLGAVHEALRERAAPAQWVSRWLGVDNPAHELIPDACVPSGNGGVLTVPQLWISGASSLINLDK